MEQAECIANNLSYFKAYESIKHVSLFLLKVEMKQGLLSTLYIYML